MYTELCHLFQPLLAQFHYDRGVGSRWLPIWFSEKIHIFFTFICIHLFLLCTYLNVYFAGDITLWNPYKWGKIAVWTDVMMAPKRGESRRCNQSTAQSGYFLRWLDVLLRLLISPIISLCLKFFLTFFFFCWIFKEMLVEIFRVRLKRMGSTVALRCQT